MCVTCKERVERLRKLAKEHGIDGFFISSEPNMRYLTGYSSQAFERLLGVVVPVNGEEPVLIVPELEVEKAMNLSSFKDIRSYSDAESPARLLGRVLDELKLARGMFGIEGFLPFRYYEILRKIAPYLEIHEVSDVFRKLRLIKLEGEIDLMKRAAKIAIKGIKAGTETVRIGISELSVAFEIEREIRESGGESVPFCTVLSGKNSALPHGSTSNKEIGWGDAVVMDIGATFDGYYADVTRTFLVGEASQDQREVYDAVLTAQKSAVGSIRPRVKTCDVDAIARRIIAEAGYGKFFTHRTGHGLGLEVHEDPYISQGDETTLEPGMTFTVEPGIYLPNRFG